MATGKGGRPRIDPKLKQLRGTLRPHREPAPAECVQLGALTAPADLGDRELYFFRDAAGILDRQGRSSPDFEASVTAYARCAAAVERLGAVLAVMGDTYEKDGGRYGKSLRARPELMMQLAFFKEMRAWAAELMLTPHSSLRLATGHKKEVNPFDDF